MYAEFQLSLIIVDFFCCLSRVVSQDLTTKKYQQACFILIIYRKVQHIRPLFNNQNFVLSLRGVLYTKENYNLIKNLIFLICFYISIFILLTRRKATETLIHRVGNYPNLLPEIPRYCCLLVI